MVSERKTDFERARDMVDNIGVAVAIVMLLVVAIVIAISEEVGEGRANIVRHEKRSETEGFNGGR